MSEWPMHPDGSSKTLVEMTDVERRAQFEGRTTFLQLLRQGVIGSLDLVPEDRLGVVEAVSNDTSRREWREPGLRVRNQFLQAALRDTLALAEIKWGNSDPDANKVFAAARDALGMDQVPGRGEPS